MDAAEPQNLLAQANRLYSQRDYVGAIGKLRALLTVDPRFFAPEVGAFIARFPTRDRSQFWTPPAGFYPSNGNLKAIFDFIYEHRVWGGGSGAGSDVQYNVAYIAYLQSLLDSQNIRSILDLGCGDWRSTRYLDLTGRDYLGVDVVPSVIAENTKRYGAANIRFAYADATAAQALPPADLVVCKDVLQHLSNRNALRVMAICRAARFALITNDF